MIIILVNNSKKLSPELWLKSGKYFGKKRVKGLSEQCVVRGEAREGITFQRNESKVWSLWVGGRGGGQ